ncbi:MAG: RNA ligase family protein [Candidatus Bathyarchaeia archaeon]
MLSSVVVQATVPKVSEEPLKTWLAKNRLGPYAVERKIDGERLQVEVSAKVVSYANRHTFLASNGDLPKLSKAILEATHGEDCWLDGELTTGVSSEFYGENGYLANRANRDEMIYVVFDILGLNGEDLRLKSYSERRQILETTLRANEKVQLVEAWTCETEQKILQVYDRVVAEGGEGVMVKPHPSIYANNAWVKMKHTATADLVILGVMKTKESFLIGHYRCTEPAGFIRYGRVSAHGWEVVKETVLKAVTGEDAQFWYVQPFVAVEIRHNGLIETSEGKTYRHPRILRLRFDKSVKDCEAHKT